MLGLSVYLDTKLTKRYFGFNPNYALEMHNR